MPMVLSSYSNSEMELHNVNSDPNFEAKQAQFIATGNLHLHHQQQQLEYDTETCPLELSNYGFLDPYFDLNTNILYPEIYPPFLQHDDFSSSNQCPKRQKLVSDFNDQNLVETPKKNSKCVSMQSIAARERRRKITEKTQELAKLVPGGNKMNTAEMLEAAFKYVKFLQAQLGVLQFMDSFPENKKVIDEENMRIVTSPKIQEKLYIEDKCLVPKDVVLSLSKSSLTAQLS